MAEDAAEHPPGAGTERHADPDLAALSGDGPRGDAVDADGGDQQGERAEEAEQGGAEALRSRDAVELVRDSARVLDRQQRIDFANRPEERLQRGATRPGLRGDHGTQSTTGPYHRGPVDARW
jgi:hypothetical protein